MITRVDVILEARSWLGTRWMHQAARKHVACDCRGLIIGVAVALGLPGGNEALVDPILRGYGREPDPYKLLRGCTKYLDPILLPQARAGDILVMRYASREPRHFAIKSYKEGTDYMIHGFAQAGQVVENRIDDKWRSRFVCAFAYRGIG